MRKKLVFLLQLLIAVLVPLAWLIMALNHASSGTLAAAGLENLKYFTVLSNLLAGLAALCYVITGRKRAAPDWAVLLNYASTAAVAVTFFTVLLFLGPLYGHRYMYLGANLFFHLLIPLLAMLAFCLMEEKRLSFRESFLPVICPLIYGTCYYINIQINGIGEWPDTNDFYGFLNWGLAFGFVIFGGILLLDWLSALALRGLHNLSHKKAMMREELK